MKNKLMSLVSAILITCSIMLLSFTVAPDLNLKKLTTEEIEIGVPVFYQTYYMTCPNGRMIIVCGQGYSHCTAVGVCNTQQ